MIKPSLLLLLLCGVGTLLPSDLQAAEQTGSAARHRVVMHLNSGDQSVQRGALNNIRHLYEELGEGNVTVELVVHGAGLALLMKNQTTLAGQLADLQRTYHVSYTACSNTMKALAATRADLIESVDRTVPAMVRLVELQEKGWAYIKP